MKIVLFTSQDIGPRLVAFLRDRPGVELLVVTQQTARDQIYGYASTKEACERLGVRCLEPLRLDEEFVQSVRSFGPELILSVYYPRIFPQALLSIPRLGAVNVHPGDLPCYRGRFAIPWAILNGENEITVSMHYLDEKVDSGPVLAKSRFPIRTGETGFELYLRAMHEAGDLLMGQFDRLVRGELQCMPQIGYGTYYTHLDARCHINWQCAGQLIERLVRVHARPYLPAYCYLINHCFYINKVSFSQPTGSFANSVGTITEVALDGRFSVSCADGVVVVEDYDVYPSMERSMLGHYIRVGAKFE